MSYVKDAALLIGAVLIGLAATAKSGGLTELFTDAAASGAGHSSHSSFSGSQLTFVLTTIIFQALGLFFVQAVLSAKSEATLKRVARYNPLYMLMYPFLVAAAFGAISLLPNKLEGAKSNEALLQLSRIVLPYWLTGIVAGGAALCAIVVLCGSALGIGSIVSRNIVPGVPESRQRIWVRGVIVAYLGVSLVLTLQGNRLARNAADHHLADSPLADYAIGGNTELTGVAGVLGEIAVFAALFALVRAIAVGRAKKHTNARS